MWFEDVEAEAMIDQLNDREPKPIHYYARRRAIDYVRKFGNRTGKMDRQGNHLGVTVSTNDHDVANESDAFAHIDAMIDANAAIARLTDTQRAAIAATIRGESLSTSERVALSRARRELARVS